MLRYIYAGYANTTDNNHIEQMKKQLRDPTATVFFLGWKSTATVFRSQSILLRATPFPADIALLTVAFLQFSQYWVLLPSKSIRWKLLLQFPLTIVLPSGEIAALNLSKMHSFSTMSQSLLFRASFTVIVFTGFLVLHTSHILTVRKSRDTRYLPPLRKSAEEQLEIRSYMQFFCWFDYTLKFKADCSTFADVRKSPSFSVPLFVPNTNRESETGCILLQVIVYFMSSSSCFCNKSATTYGLEASSKLQKKTWASSEVRRYCSLQEAEVELIAERCLEGKVRCSSAAQLVSALCILGMLRSLPASLTTFLSAFSYNFHIFMFLALVVTSLRYFP